MAKEQPEEAQSSGAIEIRTLSGRLVGIRDLQQFHDLMRQRAGIESEERGEEVMTRQAIMLLAAEGTEQIERADMGGTIQGRDCGGLEITIKDMAPVVSTREDIDTKEGYYLSMNAVCDGGDSDLLARLGLVVGQDFVLQCGALLFMVKVARLESEGAFPYKGIVVSTKTRSGNSVVKLGRAPERAVYSEVEA